MIIDAWAQHPTERHLAHPMFESLRRWTRGQSQGMSAPAGDWPISLTLGAMDQAGVSIGLLSAWVGPMGPLISNDEVAAWVSEAPDRLSSAL